MKPRDWKAGFLIVLLVYLHNTLPYLTMMPRVRGVTASMIVLALIAKPSSA